MQISLARPFACVAAVALAACSDDRGTNFVPEQPATQVRTITLEPASIAFDATGATERVVATLRDEAGAIVNGAGVEWSTSSTAVTLALPTVVSADPGIAAATTALTGREIIVVAAARGVATVTARSASATKEFVVTVSPVPVQIVIVSGDLQSATVGDELEQPLTVKVLDRLGNPIAGQSVTFTAPAGRGTVKPATTTTNAQGMASTVWTLGRVTGAGEVVVSVEGANVTARFTATALPGPAAKISVQSGNNQTGVAGTTLPVAPSVQVTDAFDNPLSGVPVIFSVVAGGGTITGATATTDANGIATAGSWTLGNLAGTNTLAASVAGSPGISTSFSATATGGAGFTIKLRFLSTMSPSQEAAFTAAAAKWSAIITGDLPDVPVSIQAGQCGGNPAINETVDDVLIFATITPIDGVGKVLGSAGPCFVRSGTNGLTVIGEMFFDAADVSSLESNGNFGSVVVHEMGHVLGVGTFWPQFGLQNPSAVGGTPRDTYLPGTNAIAGFNAIGGNTYSSGEKVPVENTGSGGTINAHWRESVLRNELMTGFINAGSNPLSILTVRSLQDLGYVVNVAAADPFFLSFSLRQSPEPDAIPLMDDVRTGPIYTIDPSGRITRIR